MWSPASFQQLDLNPLAAVCGCPGQGPDAVYDPAAPADYPPRVLPGAADFNPDATAFAGRRYFHGVIVSHEVVDDQGNEFL